MNRGIERALHLIAAAWILGGTLWYCWAFSRDVVASNRHTITRVLGR